MKPAERSLWMMGCFLAAAAPAYANNPPTVDGILGLMLVYPVAIVALRLSGAKLPGNQSAVGFGLTLVAVFAGAGGLIVLGSILVMLTYGAIQTSRVIRNGRGARRFVIGICLLSFVLFAIANFSAALRLGMLTGTLNPERAARERLEELNKLEVKFRAEARRDADRNGVGEYGTIAQLGQAYPEELARQLLTAGEIKGYRYFVVLSGQPVRDEKQYFPYASPVRYGTRPFLAIMVPSSGSRYYGRLTFASDETGVIRQRDLQASRAVTREETAGW